MGNWHRAPKIRAELSWGAQADGSSARWAMQRPVSSVAARILEQTCWKEAAQRVHLSGMRPG